MNKRVLSLFLMSLYVAQSYCVNRNLTIQNLQPNTALSVKIVGADGTEKRFTIQELQGMNCWPKDGRVANVTCEGCCLIFSKDVVERLYQRPGQFEDWSTGYHSGQATIPLDEKEYKVTIEKRTTKVTGKTSTVEGLWSNAWYHHALGEKIKDYTYTIASGPENHTIKVPDETAVRTIEH